MARQLRILQQKIEIQVIDLKEEQTKTKKASESFSSRFPPEAVKHARKSSQGHKRKDAEQKSFEKKASFDIIDIKINVQADKKEKVDMKEQKKAEKEGYASKKTSDGIYIEITEKQIDNEKILVVEKRPASTCSDAKSPSGIDFVTPSQLEILEEAIEMLRNRMPSKPFQLPGNEKLISDIMNDTVSLPEAMEILQVEKRMKSAEASIAHILEMLTHLASVDALPEEIAVQVKNIIRPLYKKADQTPPLAIKKSVAIDSKATESQPTQSQATRYQTTLSSHSRPLDTTEPSEAPTEMSKHFTSSRSSIASTSSTLKVPCVTYQDMRSHLKDLNDDITKILNSMLDKTTEITDTAQHVNKNVADKLGVAQKLDSRITALHSQLLENDSMFSGFESVLMTQLSNIEDHISQNCELMKSGLVRLAEVNNSAEVTAIMEILARSEEIDTELERVLHEHKLMMATQKELSTQSRALLDCLEMMREEKVDRDYVLDGLKDKTDKSQLAGRLKDMDFVAGQTDFNCRIDKCHEFFNRSIALWAEHVKDLKDTKDRKANIIDLLSVRDTVHQWLKVLNNKIKILFAVLGDPEVALTTRQLAVNATCGSCHESALMEPIDASSGMPPRLPALRHAPTVSMELRIPELVRPGLVENRHHRCRRWCGGSHTLAVGATKRIQVHVQMQAIPTRKYTDYGEDEHLYVLEEELQPCIECNALGGEKIQDPVPNLSSRDAVETLISHEPKPSTKCSCPLIK